LGKNVYIGLDVHNKTWFGTIICDNVIDKTKSFEPDSEKLYSYLSKRYPGANYYAAYEAGYFGYWIYRELTFLGVDVIVVNPADIPTSDKDRRSKTDKNDSKKIAQSLNAGLLTSIYIPTPEEEERRSLVRHRDDLVKKSTRLKNQIKSFIKRHGIKYPEEFADSRRNWSRNFIKWLNTIKLSTKYGTMTLESLLHSLDFFGSELSNINKELHEMSETEELSNTISILKSIPGIGIINALTLQTEIMEIQRFSSGDKYISYVGLSPTEHSSGENRHIGYLNRRCNSRLRKVFIEASWIAIKRAPALEKYFIESSNKIGKVKSIVKVARKLANRTRYLLLNNENYIFNMQAA
jgi:transposase